MNSLNQHYRPRILVESYECSPVRRHAPGAAWNILSRLSQWFEVWVITEQTQYQKEIEDYLAIYPEQGNYLHFRYIPRGNTKGFGRQRPPLPMREILDYHRWLIKSSVLARTMDQEIGFDLVHHLRSNTFREPGFLWKLGKPFVWGPIGGTYSVPSSLRSFLNSSNRMRYAARNFINRFQLAYSRDVKRAFETAAVILAQTSGDAEQFKRMHHRTAIVCHEQGVNAVQMHPRHWDGLRPLRMVWVARCIAGKSLSILLEGLHDMNTNDIELHIVGDGPELKRWKRQASRLQVDRCCVWHGWQTPENTRMIMDQADIAVFTSILEGTPATMMEAMALGLPVIALNHCGFKDVIGSENGILIECGSRENIIVGYQKAITSVLADPRMISHMSAAVLKRADYYSWDSTAQQIRDIYHRAIGRHLRYSEDNLSELLVRIRDKTIQMEETVCRK